MKTTCDMSKLKRIPHANYTAVKGLFRLNHNTTNHGQVKTLKNEPSKLIIDRHNRNRNRTHEIN